MLEDFERNIKNLEIAADNFQKSNDEKFISERKYYRQLVNDTELLRLVSGENVKFQK